METGAFEFEQFFGDVALNPSNVEKIKRNTAVA